MNKFLSIGANKIHYQVEGSGRPIVWIHGGGVDHRMWEPQVQYFRDRYQVITYDIRGHGKSEYKTNDRPDISDLEALLDPLDISNITLAGISLGGILAIDFVLAHPEKVDRLILMSPGPGGGAGEGALLPAVDTKTDGRRTGEGYGSSSSGDYGDDLLG